ncbi:MAG: serine carboxypeptidase [Pseudomonadales bacterium]|nr:serine carboxypeptidase [Halioglobus sp.]MCP5128882.1 serine carboxypeptidase [Pseudomonadales bacterium]
MNRKIYPVLCSICIGFLWLSAAAFAQEKEVEVEVKLEKQERPVPEPTTFVSQHSGTFNGEKIEYTVTAGETYLRDAEDQPKAAIFTFAYTRKLDSNTEVRPVTFVWNGGPGSASLWLHMGSFGPKRISVPSDASYPGAPPYPIINAPETILDVTDLVFVDPVGTGFSRALGKHEGKEFWGLTEDAQSMAEFIRDWVTANGRWNSPKFLLGESFGTTRAAAVANILEGNMMLSLNGIVFVSQALDYAGSTPYVRDNLISHITYLPTMAATALFHGKVSPAPADREAFLNQSRLFATDELMPALFKGNTLDPASRKQVNERLAYFTGLSPAFIERANLRVTGFRFAKELLRDQGLAVGLLDSRYTRDDIDDLNADVESDAASDAISSAFKSALMNYMRQDLNITWDRVYMAPADPELGKTWRWQPTPEGESWEPTPVNTAHALSSALRINPALKVMVASGYYDLVTPFFDAEFTLNRHDIKTDRVRYHYYDGGHMMYVNDVSRLKLLKDVRAFINSQVRHN